MEGSHVTITAPESTTTHTSRPHAVHTLVVAVHSSSRLSPDHCLPSHPTPSHPTAPPLLTYILSPSSPSLPGLACPQPHPRRAPGPLQCPLLPGAVPAECRPQFRGRSRLLRVDTKVGWVHGFTREGGREGGVSSSTRADAHALALTHTCRTHTQEPWRIHFARTRSTQPRHRPSVPLPGGAAHVGEVVWGVEPE